MRDRTEAQYRQSTTSADKIVRVASPDVALPLRDRSAERGSTLASRAIAFFKIGWAGEAPLVPLYTRLSLKKAFALDGETFSFPAAPRQGHIEWELHLPDSSTEPARL